MKICFAAGLAVALAGTALHAEDRPALPLEKAAAIAADYLKSTGRDKDHWIASISYEPATIARREFKWFVKWAPPIDLGGRKELGLEISMDGTVVRAVDKKARK